MSNEIDLQLILSATDQISNVVKSAMSKSNKSVDSFEGKLTKASDTMKKFGKSATIAGAALLGFSGLNIKFAGDFESQMANVSTLVNTSQEDMSKMGADVLNLSRKVPASISDLATSLYDIRSAGIAASSAMGTLEASAKLSIAGLSTASEATNIMTSAINAFADEGLSTEKIADIVFKTVKYGKTTVSELSQAFGSTAPIISSAKVPLAQYQAATAALTTVGTPAAEAQNKLRAAVVSLMKPTTDMEKIINSLGAKSGTELIQKNGDIGKTFTQVEAQARKMGLELVQVTGRVEAAAAITALATSTNKAYKDALGDMLSTSNELSVAYVKKIDTFNAKMQKIKNLGQAAGIEWGTALLPAMNKAIDFGEKLFDKFEKLPKPLKEFIAIGTTTAGVALVTFGAATSGMGMFLGALGKVPGAVNKAIKYAPQFASMMRMDWVRSIPVNKLNMFTGAIRGVQLAFGAGSAVAFLPMAGIIAGVVAGGFLIYKYWKPISGFFKDGFTGLKAGLEPIKPALDSIGQALKPLSDAFKGFFNQVEGGSKGADSAIYKTMEVVGKLITKVVQGWSYIANFRALMKGDAGIDEKGNVVNYAQANGSHANGLDFVPFDGYRAILHKGERVLTKEENKNFRIQPQGRGGSPINITFSPTIQAGDTSDIKKIEAMLEQCVQKLLAKLKLEQRRQEARAYGS